MYGQAICWRCLWDPAGSIPLAECWNQSQEAGAASATATNRLEHTTAPNAGACCPRGDLPLRRILWCCRRCSLRMDHHCHFISNCVGQANQRHFYLYLVFLEMAVLYCLLLAVPSWWSLKQTCAGIAPDSSNQAQHHWFGLGLFVLVDNLTAGCADDNRQNAYIMSGLICVAGFTLFLVGGLLRQQTSNLRKSVTYIEQLKAEKRVVPIGGRFSERGLGNVWRLLCTTEMDSDATCCRFWVLVPDLWTWYGLLVRMTKTQKVSL